MTTTSRERNPYPILSTTHLHQYQVDSLTKKSQAVEQGSTSSPPLSTICLTPLDRGYRIGPMDQQVYDEFKEHIEERRRLGLEQVEAEYQENLADLDRLWNRVVANNGSTPEIKPTSKVADSKSNKKRVDESSQKANWKQFVRPIVEGLRDNDISQPIITALLRANYPFLMEDVETTEVSRELRKIEREGIIELVSPSDRAKGTPNIYRNTGKAKNN